MNKITITILAIFITFIVGGIFGYQIANKDDGEKITATTLVHTLQAQGFLVTQSLILQEEVTIEKETGNAFRDFFTGQTINAQALMHVDMGVDLTRLLEKDIDISADSIQINLPPVEVREPSLSGDIMLDNKQGIVKRIFDNEDGYNEAIVLLKSQAKEAASDVEIQRKAREEAQVQLKRMVQLMGVEKEIIIE